MEVAQSLNTSNHALITECPIHLLRWIAVIISAQTLVIDLSEHMLKESGLQRASKCLFRYKLLCKPCQVAVHFSVGACDITICVFPLLVTYLVAPCCIFDLGDSFYGPYCL